jgi:hypothetical protein
VKIFFHHNCQSIRLNINHLPSENRTRNAEVNRENLQSSERFNRNESARPATAIVNIGKIHGGNIAYCDAQRAEFRSRFLSREDYENPSTKTSFRTANRMTYLLENVIYRLAKLNRSGRLDAVDKSLDPWFQIDQ